MDIDKLFRGLLGFGGLSTNLISSILGYKANQANIKQQKEANEKNIALQRETNTMQMAEAEKAYQRSKPTTQVSNLMATGMSRAGALGAITGAGTYTPPSLNTAQVEPVMSDPSAMLEALGDLSSNAMQYRASKDQLETQRKIAADNNKTQLEVATIQAEAAKYGSDNTLKGTHYQSYMAYKGQELVSRRQMETALENIGLGYAKLQEVQRQYDDMSSYNKRKFNAEIQHLNTQSNLDNERKKEIADKLAEWNSSTEKDARAAVSLMQTYLGYQTYYETELKLQQFIKHTGAQVYWHDNGAGGVVPQIRYPRDFVNSREFWENDLGTFWKSANNLINSELLAEILSVAILKK